MPRSVDPPGREAVGVGGGVGPGGVGPGEGLVPGTGVPEPVEGLVPGLGVPGSGEGFVPEPGVPGPGEGLVPGPGDGLVPGDGLGFELEQRYRGFLLLLQNSVMLFLVMLTTLQELQNAILALYRNPSKSFTLLTPEHGVHWSKISG